MHYMEIDRRQTQGHFRKDSFFFYDIKQNIQALVSFTREGLLDSVTVKKQCCKCFKGKTSYVQEEVKDVVKKMISFKHLYVLREQPKKRSSNILMKLTVKNQ